MKILYAICFLIFCAYGSALMAADSSSITMQKNEENRRVVTQVTTPFPHLFYTAFSQTIYSSTDLKPSACPTSAISMPPQLPTYYKKSEKWYSTSIYYECGKTGQGSTKPCDYTDRYTDTVQKLDGQSTTEPKTLCANYPTCTGSDVIHNPNITHKCSVQVCKTFNGPPPGYLTGFYKVYIYTPTTPANADFVPYMCVTHGWAPAPAH